MLFIPFVYWLVPRAVYKVSEQDVFKQMKGPKVQQTKASYVNIFGIGLTILLSRLLELITKYLEVNTTNHYPFDIFTFNYIPYFTTYIYT